MEIVFEAFFEMEIFKQHLEWLGCVHKIREKYDTQACLWVDTCCLLACWYYTNADINKDDLNENHREEREFSDASQGEAI